MVSLYEIGEVIHYILLKRKDLMVLSANIYRSYPNKIRIGKMRAFFLKKKRKKKKKNFFLYKRGIMDKKSNCFFFLNLVNNTNKK